METPENVCVLVAASPYLLATALADMLAMEGFRVRVVSESGATPERDHVCVALIDETAPSTLPPAAATVQLPTAFATGSVIVDLGGRRRTKHVERPRDLVRLVASLAVEAACCTTVSLAAG